MLKRSVKLSSTMQIIPGSLRLPCPTAGMGMMQFMLPMGKFM